MNNVFVTLPPDLIATRFAGYYFHIVEQRLYSLKSGELKQIKRQCGNSWNDFKPGYRISHKGIKIFLREDYLINRSHHPQKTIVTYHVNENTD